MSTLLRIENGVMLISLRAIADRKTSDKTCREIAVRALAALDGGIKPGWAYCPLCEQVVRTIDDGETCSQCKLVL